MNVYDIFNENCDYVESIVKIEKLEKRIIHILMTVKLYFLPSTVFFEIL